MKTQHRDILTQRKELKVKMLREGTMIIVVNAVQTKETDDTPDDELYNPEMILKYPDKPPVLNPSEYPDVVADGHLSQSRQQTHGMQPSAVQLSMTLVMPTSLTTLGNLFHERPLSQE